MKLFTKDLLRDQLLLSLVQIENVCLSRFGLIKMFYILNIILILDQNVPKRLQLYHLHHMVLFSKLC